VDGVSVCRTIRDGSVVPIVMLTARTDPIDVVLGLEAGADDYVTKPFEPSILAARLRAVLRRVALHDASPALHIRDLVIDRAGMEVHVAGEPVSLTPTEYRLLLELAEHSGVVCSRERLLEEVWGYVWAGDTRLVDMHIRRLRAKIGCGQYPAAVSEERLREKYKDGYKSKIENRGSKIASHPPGPFPWKTGR
jgi:DNA-binding response OmpR family regulator